MRTTGLCTHMSSRRTCPKECFLQGNLVHIQERVGSREAFPLPTLGPKLEACREEVRIGRGFQLLRRARLPPFQCLSTFCPCS